MTSLMHPLSETRSAAGILSEVVVARLALGVIGLHVVDDNFLQPEPGVSSTANTARGLGERVPNQGFYTAAGEPKEIWEVPGAQHVGGITTQPQEYERRVIAFFDGALLED